MEWTRKQIRILEFPAGPSTGREQEFRTGGSGNHYTQSFFR